MVEIKTDFTLQTDFFSVGKKNKYNALESLSNPYSIYACLLVLCFPSLLVNVLPNFHITEHQEFILNLGITVCFEALQLQEIKDSFSTIFESLYHSFCALWRKDRNLSFQSKPSLFVVTTSLSVWIFYDLHSVLRRHIVPIAISVRNSSF